MRAPIKLPMAQPTSVNSRAVTSASRPDSTSSTRCQVLIWLR